MTSSYWLTGIFLPCLAFIIEAMVIFIVVRGLASLLGEEQWAIKFAWFTAARKSPPLNQDSSLRGEETL